MEGHFVADFETLGAKSHLYEETYGGVDYSSVEERVHATQKLEETRVWGTALMPVSAEPHGDDVVISNNIDTFFKQIQELPSGSIVWFHNLSFDVEFIVTWMLTNGYTRSKLGLPADQEQLAILQAMDETIEEMERTFADADEIEQKRRQRNWYNTTLEKQESGGFNKPKAGEFVNITSDTGAWYSLKITFKANNKAIEFRDSFKILPFSLDTVASALQTKAKKLTGSVDFEKYRPADHQLTDTEIKYIKNDVLVASEALHLIGDTEAKLTDNFTIGGACMKDLLTMWGGTPSKGRRVYRNVMPAIDVELDAELREAYRGGWCINYTDGDIVGALDGTPRGHTFDVNSLYPSVMLGRSYPVGEPLELPANKFKAVLKSGREYIVKLRAHIIVKDNHVPFYQDKAAGSFSEQVHVYDSEVPIEMTLTRPDYELMREQYRFASTEVLKLWTFQSETGLFDEYIEKWYEIRMQAKRDGNAVMDFIAKLMLNNLYGKLSQAPVRGSYIPHMGDDGKVAFTSFETVSEGGYIPAGAYITAYARGVTVRGAQAIIDAGMQFLYADTDSLHFIGPLDKVNLDIGKKLGQWDHESSWDVARFVRQKTYVERLVIKDGKTLAEPKLDLKASGCPASTKERLLHRCSVIHDDGTATFWRLERDEHDNVITPRRDDLEVIERFTVGLVEAGKLRRKRVIGGVILEETTFRIHL